MLSRSNSNPGSKRGSLEDGAIVEISPTTGKTVGKLIWRSFKKSDPDPTFPPPRHVHTCVYYKQSVFIYGGYDGKHLGDFWEFNLNTKEWRQIKSKNAPSARHSLSCVVYGDSLYFFGGIAEKSILSDEIYEYKILSDQWSKVKCTGTHPTGRWGHTAVVSQHTMFVFGGLGDQYMNDLYEYSFLQKTWRQIFPSGNFADMPKPRHYHSAVVYNNCMYVWGGYNSGVGNLNDFHKFNFDTKQWEVLPSVLQSGDGPSKRRGHACAMISDHQMAVFAGRSKHNERDFYTFDFLTNQWDEFASRTRPLQPRHFHSMTLAGKSVFIFGGINGKCLNDLDEIFVESLQVDSNSDSPRDSRSNSLHRTGSNLDSNNNNSGPSTPLNGSLEVGVRSRSNRVKLKCFFEMDSTQETRLITVPTDCTYDALQEKLRSEYFHTLVQSRKNENNNSSDNSNPGSSNIEICDILVQYYDLENDLITIRSQADLEIAMEDFLDLSQNFQSLQGSPQGSVQSGYAAPTALKLYIKVKSRPKSTVTSPTVAKNSDNAGANGFSSGTIFRSETHENAEVTSWQQGPLIGKGSFGAVYLSLNLENGKLLAVKKVELNNTSAEEAHEVQSLEKEISLLKNLKHVNIVQYLGTHRSDTNLYIFLEYVPGGSIAGLLHKFGALNESVIKIYLKQVLAGLSYLHQNDIIHRDIKGANILVSEAGTVKLADFGASKKLADIVTVKDVRTFVGTPFFMAPEVIRQSGHGKPADVWSVGCTVIEMAETRPPWSHHEPVAALFLISSETTPIPCLPNSFSEEIRSFLSMCLQRDTKQRATVEQLLLHPFLV